MDDIIEFIIELILDVGAEAAGSKKVPKWIRYPLMAIFGLMYAALTIGLFVGGVWVLAESVIFGAVLILLGLVILFAGCHTIRKQWRKHQDEKIEPYL